MGVIRHKIWKDLWTSKSRTLQVVLIIGMGAFALGMIITTRNLMIGGMEELWRDSAPAMIGMWASPPVDDDTLSSLKRIEGLEKVEGYATSTVEWRLDEGDEWLSAGVIVRQDYENQQFARVDLLSGTLPGRNTVVAGQGSDVTFGAIVGEEVTFKVNGRERTYTISGSMYDPIAQPPSFGGNAQFFVTQDTFETLFGFTGYNRIFAAADYYEESHVVAVANDIQDKLERQGVESGGMLPPQGNRIVDPNKHFFQDIMDGIFFVLGVMAVLALFLGLFLVYNTINAIISQQVDQIGVMKAIGASSWQILSIYLLYVLAFGVLALLLAVPLGMMAGWQLNVFLMDSFNAEAGGFQVSWTAVFVQIIIALVTPLLVAAVPVINGARITVREAVSTYGLATSMSYLDRLLAKMKRVSRLLLLTISNTFRNKWRVILTQITLVLSGLIFMMVMSVSDSTNYTFNDLLFSILNSNINLRLQDSERISVVESLTMQHPNVQAVEMWGLGSGSAHAQSVLETDDDPGMLAFGVPAETTLYGHQMRAGRWLTADDTYAVVLNQELADEMGVGLGDWITFNQGTEGESDWQVVGLLFDPLITNSAHVPRTTLLREQNRVGRTNSVWIQLKLDTPAAEQTAVRELRQLYEDNGIDVRPGGILNGQDTSSEIIDSFNTQFRSITTMLAVMAVVIGVVGSISLSGVLSLSVIERQREIGVMRAVGASSWDIARLFIGEGLILGLLSWVIALPFSIPAGQVITSALSGAMGIEFVYYYTPQGAITWFVIITVLSTLASWIPARRATRISVRDSLAYL